MSNESMKDAILKNLEANLAEAMRRGDTKEIKRLQEQIERFEIDNMDIKRGDSTEIKKDMEEETK